MKITLVYLLIFCSLTAHAEISEEQIAADCLKVKSFATQGDKYYKLGQYSKAREQYEQQAAWSESCGFDEGKIATAYNNVALTYIHENNYLKARAWLSILPNDKKSIFNLNKIKNKLDQTLEKTANPQGEYWHYSGKSMWDVITIKKAGTRFSVNFEGFYAGLMAMYSGPNMGEFSTVLAIKNGRARYSMADEKESYGNCVYDFLISKDSLKVDLVSGDSCGFGHNVSAEGHYSKVGF